jgi:acetyltransferase-like isoleucine patch superfamily enzyme
MRRSVGASRFGRFGEGSAVVPPAIVVSPHRIFLGDRVLIHDRAWFSVVEHHNDRTFEPRLTIGDDTVFGRDAYFSCVGHIDIGRNVLAADRVFITDTYHDYRDPHTAIADQPMADPERVRVGDGAFLGVGTVVLMGVTIGERAYVGAGAVVTKDVPANAVVIGNPARVVRRWDSQRGNWLAGEAAEV